MEIISRVSKGSKMDQVYLPKNRFGLDIGSYVVVKQLEEEKTEEKFYFYGVEHIEPIKLDMLKKIIKIIDKQHTYENVIFTGSFLDSGFNFNDIDILLIGENKPAIKEKIENKIGIKAHIIFIDNKSLMRGLSTDPIYQMMLSRCISKKRIIYSYKSKINYKILDLHLLKSKSLPENFDILRGGEKYYLTRNMIAILLYLNNTKVNKREVDNEIKKIFNLSDIDEIKENLLDKNKFIKKYRLVYNQLFKRTLEGINNESKQKKHNWQIYRKLINAVIHEILEKAINDEQVSKRYNKEISISLDKAEIYREKINPINKPLSNKDLSYLKTKILNKVKTELKIRISKGYKNIDLTLADELMNKMLKDIGII